MPICGLFMSATLAPVFRLSYFCPLARTSAGLFLLPAFAFCKVFCCRFLSLFISRRRDFIGSRPFFVYLPRQTNPLRFHLSLYLKLRRPFSSHSVNSYPANPPRLLSPANSPSSVSKSLPIIVIAFLSLHPLALAYTQSFPPHFRCQIRFRRPLASFLAVFPFSHRHPRLFSSAISPFISAVNRVLFLPLALPRRQAALSSPFSSLSPQFFHTLLPYTKSPPHEKSPCRELFFLFALTRCLISRFSAGPLSHTAFRPPPILNFFLGRLFLPFVFPEYPLSPVCFSARPKGILRF